MGQSAPNPIPTSELLTGRRDTLDRLMPEVYEELRGIARRQLAGHCRFFGDMNDDDIAEALEVTPRTVQRDWAKARMLLRRALSP